MFAVVGVLLLLLAQSQGSSRIIKYQTYTYEVHLEKKVYNDAVSACRQAGGAVVYFQDDAEYAHVVNELDKIGKETGIEYYYIGLKQDSQSVAKSSHWSNGAPVTINHWAPGEPNSLLEMCTTYEIKDDKWHDVMCNRAEAFVCKLFGSRTLKHSSSTYEVHFDIKSNHAAEGACKQRGGHLAFFHDNADYMHVVNELTKIGQETGIQYYYIGLKQDSPSVSTSSNWINGEAVTINHWANNEPDSLAELCTTAEIKDGKWHDVMCDREEAFVCRIRVDGGWGNWTDYGACSTTCGQGVKIRSRECNNPLPQSGGRDCLGSSKESVPCELKQCPAVVVNGNWSAWSEWTKCSLNRKGKCRKYHYRKCNNPEPQNGGKKCKGRRKKGKRCPKSACSNQ